MQLDRENYPIKSSADPPNLTLNQLEQFFGRVYLWHKRGTELNHTWFESDAKEYVRRKGYGFQFVNDNARRKQYWKVVKLD
jgi:hypothetical protein